MSDRKAPPPRRRDSRSEPVRDLVESFDALALAGKKPRGNSGAGARQARDPTTPTPPQRSFVGGFHREGKPPRAIYQTDDKPLPRPPQLAPVGYPYIDPNPRPHDDTQAAPGALPAPPPTQHVRMPVPQHTRGAPSRTMHYAMAMPLPPPPIIYPEAQPALAPPTPTPPSRPQSDSSVPSASSTSTGRARAPRTPQPPKLVAPTLHRRTQSSPPPSPVTSVSTVGTRTPGTVQCSGMTNAGKRCTRKCKSSLGADEDVFCHQHTQSMNAQMTIYDRKSNTHKISFSDWIPEYLQETTKASLRSEMEKSRSPHDVPGYIYTFEILDDTTPGYVHLKVGRATNLNRRMDQWGKQCGSKEQLLRGWWPSAIETDETSFMKGRIQAGDKGAWCHRLERLVHIELADLATNRPYLDPAFPNNVVDPANAVKGTPKKNAGKPDIKRCPDCNTAHREIFSFERVKAGRYKGKEWDLIVKPVIEKWGGYVEAYV